MRRLFAGCCLAVLFYDRPYDEIGDGQQYGCDDYGLDVFRIFIDFIFELVFRYERMKIPSHGGQDAVPHARSDCRIKNELGEVHFRQSGRNGDELPYGGEDAAHECGRHAVVGEELLALSIFS